MTTIETTTTTTGGAATRWQGAVTAIVEDLVGSATIERDGLRWDGPTIVGDETDWAVTMAPLGTGVYSGRAGVLLFLASAIAHDRVLDVDVDGELRWDVLATAWALVDDAAWGLDVGMGTFGLGDSAAGTTWAVGWIAHLLGDDELLAAARELAGAAAGALSTDGPLDLLVGTAGALLAVLGVAGDDAGIAARCRDVAHQLAAAADPQPIGAAWTGPDGVALAGLSHGASGVALALAEVAAATGDPSLWATVEAALAHERSLFDPHEPGWPDLRPTDGGVPGHPALWCHGAVGIGLARLRLLDIAPPRLWAQLVAEAGAAVHATRRLVARAHLGLEDGMPTDCSLCHGLAGPAALFVAGGQLEGGEPHQRAARRTGTLMLDQHERLGSWPCGVRDAGESPSLFLGTAGIGATLLRIAHPATTPAVEILQALPIARG